jgi:starch synthase
MNVMHLSAECYPVAKVGGLGDVVGALPKYLCEAGINASVVLPYYDRKFVRENYF